MTQSMSAISGVYGSSFRPTNKSHSIGAFEAPITIEEIKAKHPERTNPAHIQTMQYFMNQGMSFEEAHEAAIAYGYDPMGGGGHHFW